VAANTQRIGVHEGVAFEYTTVLRRPANALIRALAYAHALAGVTIRLLQMRRMRHHTAVWLYMNGGCALLYCTWLCQLLGLAVIQEYGEWWPAHTCTSPLGRWAYRKPLIRSSSGALVISRAIEDRLRGLAARMNPQLLIYRLPALVDVRRFDRGPETGSRERAFVWCGTEQWIADVMFLTGALAEVRRQGHPASLTVVGSFGEAHRRRIQDHASANGLSDRDLVFTGFVDDDALSQHYRGALALLLPMPDDEESLTRMPNKLGEYLASGRPVITSGLGELRLLLDHGVNAYLARPGDEKDFAEQMIAVLREPATARDVGRAGRNTCRKHLDYRSHSHHLAEWVSRCIAHGGKR
jgi:glycosyltransferase involved in cell wall biosynthesis